MRARTGAPPSSLSYATGGGQPRVQLKVSFRAQPRTHGVGHFLPVTIDNFRVGWVNTRFKRNTMRCLSSRCGSAAAVTRLPSLRGELVA